MKPTSWLFPIGYLISAELKSLLELSQLNFLNCEFDSEQGEYKAAK